MWKPILFIHLKLLTCKGPQSRGRHGAKPLFIQTGAPSSIHITEQETHVTNSFISNNGSIQKGAVEKLYYLLNTAFIVKILTHLCLAQLIHITPSVCTVCILTSRVNHKLSCIQLGLLTQKIPPECPQLQETKFK